MNFEKEFSGHQHTQYCIAVTSGTTALITAMAALEVGPGNEVILPAWTWYACYDAIILWRRLAGFRRGGRFVDIDPTDIERLHYPPDQSIRPVHILGRGRGHGPHSPIRPGEETQPQGCWKNCAQSMGVTYLGLSVGSMGECGIYSFQINKTISSGDGGAFVTSDPYRFERGTRFHDCGVLRDGHAKVLGQPSRVKDFSSPQYRMNEFTAGVMR